MFKLELEVKFIVVLRYIMIVMKKFAIAPKALILGNVKINEYAYIGANAT